MATLEQQLEMSVTTDMIRQNSFGITDKERNVELHITIGINSDTYGWFELYDIESGGEDWYAEGSLTFDNKRLIDYDGVYCLSNYIIEKLKEMGYDTSEIE
jgi:hypothetical protein